MGLILLLVFATQSASCPAQENSALILAARGEVSVISHGNSRPVKRGDFIREQDQVVAGERSFASLQLFDGAKISLRPDSAITIEQFSYGTGEDTATIMLSSGGIKLVAGAIANQDSTQFFIRTPNSLLTPNASESSISLCGDEACNAEGLLETDQ